MKVAFTTSTGAIVDGNFRKSCSFSVWDVGPHESYYVSTIHIRADAINEDDRIAARAEALRECAIVCAKQISGPAAAKLVTRNIHPLRTGDDVPVEEIIGRLQGVLKNSPPPWMRKAQSRDVSGFTQDGHAW
jgi:nitrogen fixation protein NifX